jgi:hypothetical protein
MLINLKEEPILINLLVVKKPTLFNSSISRNFILISFVIVKQPAITKQPIIAFIFNIQKKGANNTALAQRKRPCKAKKNIVNKLKDLV